MQEINRDDNNKLFQKSTTDSPSRIAFSRSDRGSGCGSACSAIGRGGFRAEAPRSSEPGDGGRGRSSPPTSMSGRAGGAGGGGGGGGGTSDTSTPSDDIMPAMLLYQSFQRERDREKRFGANFLISKPSHAYLGSASTLAWR